MLKVLLSFIDWVLYETRSDGACSGWVKRNRTTIKHIKYIGK